MYPLFQYHEHKWIGFLNTFSNFFLIISTYTDFEVTIEFFQVLNNFSTICIKRKKIQHLFTNYWNIGINIY